MSFASTLDRDVQNVPRGLSLGAQFNVVNASGSVARYAPNAPDFKTMGAGAVDTIEKGRAGLAQLDTQDLTPHAGPSVSRQIVAEAGASMASAVPMAGLIAGLTAINPALGSVAAIGVAVQKVSDVYKIAHNAASGAGTSIETYALDYDDFDPDAYVPYAVHTDEEPVTMASAPAPEIEEAAPANSYRLFDEPDLIRDQLEGQILFASQRLSDLSQIAADRGRDFEIAPPAWALNNPAPAPSVFGIRA
tara:strand:+ start:164902 stop:165645 length:744 start_codon:yes stop_codon:yes gene_type:complete